MMPGVDLHVQSHNTYPFMNQNNLQVTLHSSYTFENIKNDYDEYEMDLTNLELGTPGDLVPKRDGYSGETYLGKQLTLYIRRSQLVGKKS